MGMDTHVKRGHPSPCSFLFRQHSFNMPCLHSHLWAPNHLRNHRGMCPCHTLSCILLKFFQLSLSAWLTSRFNKYHDYSSITERDRVRFVLFSSVWTVVLGLLFSVLFFHSASGSVLTSILSHGVLYVHSHPQLVIPSQSVF